MKKFYSKFTNSQNWRSSVSNALFSKKTNENISNENTHYSSSDDSDKSPASYDIEEDISTDECHGIYKLNNDNVNPVVPRSSENESGGDNSDIYCIPGTSLTTSEDQPYQNIIDMSEELEKLKRKHTPGVTQFIITERPLSDCYDETNLESSDTTTTTDKYFECETTLSSERSSIERDEIIPNNTLYSVKKLDLVDFDDHYSENFTENYSSKDNKSNVESPPKLTPKKQNKTRVISEYDIPRITFSFVDKESNFENNYEVLNIKTPTMCSTPNTKTNENESIKCCKSEIRITLAQPTINNSPTVINDNFQTFKSKDIKYNKQNNNLINKSKSHENIILLKQCSKNKNNKNPFPQEKLTKSLTDFSNLTNRKKISSLQKISMEKIEPIYAKIAKKDKRTSISLGNLQVPETDSKLNKIENNIRSLENIEIARINSNDAIVKSCLEKKLMDDELEYCTHRDKLPTRIRQATKIKRAFIRNRAEHTWDKFRTRLNNIIANQAAAQRVDAQSETATSLIDKYPKATKSVDQMYKKTKKKLSKINDKLFDGKRNLQILDKTSDRSLHNQHLVNNIKHCTIEEKCDENSLSCNSYETYKSDSNGDGSNNVTTESDIDSFNNRSSSITSSEIMRDNKQFPSDTTLKLNVIKKFSYNGSDTTVNNRHNDFNTIKSTFHHSKYTIVEGQNGFNDLRRFIKQGNDFCKELSTILQERCEAELQYAKSLSKLSNKLNRVCRDNIGSINEAWKNVSADMETRAEVHRQYSAALLEDIVKPLRFLTESQHKIRKNIESQVDKNARTLSDWRIAEAKSKKQSHSSARDNEKLQDAFLDVRLSRSTSLTHLSHTHGHKTISDKETAKLEVKKRKAEEAVKKSDVEYYTLCVRAERARLEWELAVLRGTGTFQTIEEERLKHLKSYLNSYLHICNEMGPRIQESTECLKAPIIQCDPSKDIHTFVSLKNSSQHISEQLLPDFYCEHITLAMNRDRRKQALIKLLQLIRQDLERESKSKQGLENLSRAIKQTPNFGTDDSQQNVCEKMYHIRSMLTYLEGARYKVQKALAEIDNQQRVNHPLAAHITVIRDKSGLQQSILKVPPWLRKEAEKVLIGAHIATLPCNDIKDKTVVVSEWIDRGMGDGNSNQLDSDFDEFSSQSSESIKQEGTIHIEENLESNKPRENENEDDDIDKSTPICHCRALYTYKARLSDELSLYPGDVLAVYRQQPDGWWLGECAGSIGIFPATYVEQIEI